MGLSRCICLALLLSATCAVAVIAPLTSAYAKDGGGSDGGGGSGHGGGDDHGGNGGGDDHGGRGRGGDVDGMGISSGGGSDYDRARDAVRDGQIMALKTMLQKIDIERYGRIIDIRLGRASSRDIYQVKLRDEGGVIRILRIDARSGVVIGRN